MTKLSFELNLPTTLFCDNTLSNSWAASSDSMQCSNHIDIKLYFVQESVTNGHVDTEDIDSEDKRADGITKPQMKAKF